MNRHLVSGLIIILGIICFITILLSVRNTKRNEGIHDEVQSFNVGNYNGIISQFSTDKTVLPISNASDAAQKAETLWVEQYGDQVITKKPFVVCYDDSSKVWMVHGTLPNGIDGGVPYCIIEGNTGRVLAIWHDK